MLSVSDLGQGAGLRLSLSLRHETVAAEAMEGVVWTAVKGFEPPCAIFFGIGISIKIVLLPQIGSIWPN